MRIPEGVDPRYKLRKVLCPRVTVGYPVMTIARYVPWGLPLEPDGIRVSALCRYLGLRRDRMTHLLRRLGIPTVYEAPQSGKRNARGQFMLLTEEDAAKVIVHVRARAGEKSLKARAASPAEPSE